MHDEHASIDRRMVLAGLGGLLAGGTLGSPSLLASDQSGSLPGYLPEEAWKGEPAVMSGRAPFDLSDPMQNWFALMKSTNNLVGARTYVPMFMRVFFGPQGKAPFPLYTSFGMWTWQLQRPEPGQFKDLQRDDVIQRALYTGVICDPWTFEPIDRLHIPYTGNTVETRDSLFAESWLLRSGGRGYEGIDRPGFRSVDEERQRRGTPYVRFGEDVAFNIAGLLQTEGPAQPRMDGSFWTVREDELMSPEHDLVEATYSFAGVSRARERPWLGLDPDDDSQLLMNTQGRKVHSVERIPRVIQETLLKKYPDRI